MSPMRCAAWLVPFLWLVTPACKLRTGVGVTDGVAQSATPTGSDRLPLWIMGVGEKNAKPLVCAFTAAPEAGADHTPATGFTSKSVFSESTMLRSLHRYPIAQTSLRDALVEVAMGKTDPDQALAAEILKWNTLSRLRESAALAERTDPDLAKAGPLRLFAAALRALSPFKSDLRSKRANDQTLKPDLDELRQIAKNSFVIFVNERILSVPAPAVQANQVTAEATRLVSRQAQSGKMILAQSIGDPKFDMQEPAPLVVYSRSLGKLTLSLKEADAPGIEDEIEPFEEGLVPRGGSAACGTAVDTKARTRLNHDLQMFIDNGTLAVNAFDDPEEIVLAYAYGSLLRYARRLCESVESEIVLYADAKADGNASQSSDAAQEHNIYLRRIVDKNAEYLKTQSDRLKAHLDDPDGLETTLNTLRASTCVGYFYAAFGKDKVTVDHALQRKTLEGLSVLEDHVSQSFAFWAKEFEREDAGASGQ